MIKYIKNKLLGLLLVAAVLTGCDTASQEVADIVSSEDYPYLTFTTDASGDVFAEGDTIIYYVTMDKWLDRSVTIRAYPTAGEATAADFEVTPGVIAPYTDSTSVMVIIAMDDDDDPDETVTLEFGATSLADKYLVNPESENASMSFSITDYDSPSLRCSFAWDADVEVNPNYADYPDHVNIEHARGEMDFDIAFYDATGAMVPFYDAMTGAEPEECVLTGWPAGNYLVTSYLYENNFLDSATYYTQTVEMKQIPFTASFVQAGVYMAEVEQDDSQVLNTASANDSETVICEIEVKDDGTYEVRGYTESVILAGKPELEDAIKADMSARRK